jgi:hypothetical protein
MLRPVVLTIEVTRRRDGEDMRSQYVGFTARLTLLGRPEMRAHR